MLKRMALSYARWCRRSRKQEGFVLLDYLLSIAVGAVLAALVCTGLGRTALSWQHLLGQLELLQAGSYMQGALERQLCYNATAVKIKAAGDLELDTVDGNKKLLIYCRNKGLYLQTVTGNGSGTNPLFITGAEVASWEVAKIQDQLLRIDFTLQGEQERRSFVQLLTLCNGEVIDERL